jgi:hypothetical protein
MDLLDLWIQHTIVLPNHDVLSFLQLREHSFLVTIRDVALKLKQGIPRWYFLEISRSSLGVWGNSQSSCPGGFCLDCSNA